MAARPPDDLSILVSFTIADPLAPMPTADAVTLSSDQYFSI